MPLGIILVAVLALRFAPRFGLSSSPNRGAVVLGLAWGLMPPVLLWLISQQQPLFDWRYMVFTLPGTALLMASLATFVRPYGILIPVLALAMAGWPMQLLYRNAQLGHSEDLRGTTAYIAANARQGDAVLFVPWFMRVLEQMYPERFTALNDIAIGTRPNPSSTIFGVEKPADEIGAALASHRRVWLVTGLDGMAEHDEHGRRRQGPAAARRLPDRPAPDVRPVPGVPVHPVRAAPGQPTVLTRAGVPF